MVLAMRHVGVVALIALLVAAGIFARETRPPHLQQVQAAGPIGTGWQQYDLIVSPGDWYERANAAPDIIARKAADGTLWLFSGDGAGGYKGPRQIASGFGGYTHLVAAGKFTGHSRPDLMAIRNDGELILFPNLGNGVLGDSVPIASGWGAYDAVVGAYNFSGFHRPDLIARNATDGSLTLFAGDGHGGFSGSSLITSTSLSAFSRDSTGSWNWATVSIVNVRVVNALLAVTLPKASVASTVTLNAPPAEEGRPGSPRVFGSRTVNS